MLRQATRGVAFLVLFASVLDSASRGQQPAAADRVYYRDKKDGSVKQVEGELKASPSGFQVVNTDKKVVATVSPSDVIRVVPGEIPVPWTVIPTDSPSTEPSVRIFVLLETPRTASRTPLG